ncbi:MAG: Flp pilus assembly protein CpaB [Paracoccaceae bacterium]
MRLIGILVLVVGVGLAGGALYYAKGILAKQQSQPKVVVEQAETVPVIVAAENIDYGQPIEEALIRIVDWPAVSVPQGAFASPEDLVGDINSERRVALRKIDAGEPILESKVTGFGEDSRIAMMLREGRRAFSISIDVTSGVAGFVSPGDRVDILLTDRNKDGGLVSRVVLSNVQVIAVDQRAQTSGLTPKVGRTATVDVSAREAQKLALAQQIGRLSLILRGARDFVAIDEKDSTVDLDDLRGIER